MSDATITLGDGKTYILKNVQVKSMDYGQKPIPSDAIYDSEATDELVLVPSTLEATVRVEYTPSPNLYTDLIKKWAGFATISIWDNGRKAEQDAFITSVGEDSMTMKLIGGPRWGGLDDGN